MADKKRAKKQSFVVWGITIYRPRLTDIVVAAALSGFGCLIIHNLKISHESHLTLAAAIFTGSLLSRCGVNVADNPGKATAIIGITYISLLTLSSALVHF